MCYLVSTGSLPNATGKKYTDFTALPELYHLLKIDGLELVFLPEWNKSYPPLTQSSTPWKDCIKVSIDELTHYFKTNKINVPSVHLNRDIGNYLCSSNKDMIKIGQRILNENLQGAKDLNSQIAVLHLWDTYSDDLNIPVLFNYINEITSHYDIPITIENIPISDQRLSTYDIWNILKNIMPEEYGFTLDLNWCSQYNNFNELKLFNEKIYNIHVQGLIKENVIVPKVGSLNYFETLNDIYSNHYNHFITLELNQPQSIDDFRLGLDFIKRICQKRRID